MAWALVTGGTVTAVYNNPKGITIGGIQHPRNIFTQWSAADLKAIGIYSHDTVGHRPDDRFYTVGAPSTVVDDTAGTVVVTYPSVDKALADSGSADDNDLQLGLKSQAKITVKAQAAGALQDSDWMVIREAEGGTAVASAVATYRAAVRTKSGSMESAITSAANMAKFVALHESTGTFGESDYVEAVLRDWPTVPDALK
tara:strand:+ start:1035 stop:1631 length:597 start_codon:yes stop_codon:yes gene_type:complete